MTIQASPPSPLHSFILQSEKLNPKTKRAYLHAINQWLIFAGNDPKNWTIETCKRFYQDLRSRMKPQSANKLMWGLRYVSKKYAKSTKTDDFADHDLVELVKAKESDRRRSLSPKEVKKLLSICQGDSPTDLRDRALILIAIATGMRRSSICGMSFENLNKENEIAFVNVPIKGGRTFSVPIAKQALKALDAWSSWLKSQGISKGSVFRSISLKRTNGTFAIGETLSEDGLYKTIQRRNVLAGIEGLSPHIFRHTFVTWCQQVGMKEHQIGSITGHISKNLSGVIDSVYTDRQVIARDALTSVEEMLENNLS